MSCCLIFKRNKITPFGSAFLKFTARCSDCNGVLTGISYTEPQDVESALVINCEYVGNFQNCRSSKKRKLIGNERREYARKLVEEKKTGSIAYGFETCH